MNNGWKDGDLAQADLLYCIKKGFLEFVKIIPFGNERQRLSLLCTNSSNF